MSSYPPYNNLEEAAYATLVYCDLFDFAPTLLEIEKWLLRYGNGAERATLTQIRQALESHPNVHCTQGMYFVNSREHLIEMRKKKYAFTEAKFQHARPFLRILSYMPFVRSIWLSNSMGWNNANRTSDIDIVIIAEPGHIWTARFFTTIAMTLLRQRPGEQRPSKALCLSFYATHDSLNFTRMRASARDIHFAFWCAQMYPVYGFQYYEKYIQANGWLYEVFHNPQWTAASPTRVLPRSDLQRSIRRIFEAILTPRIWESWLKRFQYRMLPEQIKEMANRDTRVMLQESVLKLHTNDRRHKLEESFQEAVQKRVSA